MPIPTVELRRLCERCVIAAYPRWQDRGVRIANHRLRHAAEAVEWLTIFRPDGSVRIWQHYPDLRDIGTMSRAEVALLMAPPPRRSRPLLAATAARPARRR